MTLDPVHLDGVAALARQIRHETEGTDHAALAETVWTEFLDPLYGPDGAVVLEPIDGLERFRAPVDELGLAEPAVEAVHGLDSGTVNPRTFANGLVLDVAQAAMSATPSDLELHRDRTIVTSVHSNDATVETATDWQPFEAGYGRGRVVDLPRLARDRQRAVHGLALALSESAHALRFADAVGELLLLDGPLYPPPVVAVATRQGDAGATLAEHPLGREVCANYADLVERFVEREVPLVGFVKTAESSALLRALAGRERPPATPWADDLAFFTRLLEPGGSAIAGGGRAASGGRSAGRGATGEAAGSANPDPGRSLTWTNWFVSSLGGAAAFAGDRAPPGVDRALEPADYRVAFFVVHDPRVELSFRVELPAAQAADPALRETVRRQVLRGVAAEAGPPTAIRKADALARIGQGEAASLLERLEDTLGSRRTSGYDELRWGIDA